MVRDIRHFGIVVSDLGRSLRFYRDLLGLKVTRTHDESGEYIDKVLSLKDVRVTTVKMSADNGPTLVELLEFQSHPSQPSVDRRIFSVGPSHVAFTVDNLDAVYQQLSQAGVHFIAPPQQSPNGYARVAFCQDPDGTQVELVEEL